MKHRNRKGKLCKLCKYITTYTISFFQSKTKSGEIMVEHNFSFNLMSKNSSQITSNVLKKWWLKLDGAGIGTFSSCNVNFVLGNFI